MCFLPQDEKTREVAIGPVRALRPGRTPTFDRLARRAGEPQRAGCGGGRRDAGDPPGHRRPRRAHRQPGRLRAQAPGHPQADPEPPGPDRGQARPARPDRILHAVVLDPDGGSTRAWSWPTRSASSTTTCATPAPSRPWPWCTQRFSTNTFPSWRLAHPYRFIAHNGEINTVRGNVNWMSARRRTLESDLLGPDLDKMWPLIPHGQSDTACLDNALELLLAGGYPLAHAVMMLIPEAWAGNPLMDPKRKAFYEYYAALMEPWDGAGGDRLHRRPPDRRHPRPQRPAPGALRRHRRAGGDGLRGRGAADPGRSDPPQVGGCSRARCC